jgi:hypothetical protein
MFERLKETLHFFQKNLFRFGPLFMLLALPEAIVPLLTGISFTDPEPRTFFMTYVPLMLFGVLSIGMIAFRLRDILDARPLSITHDFQRASARYFHLFGAIFLTMIAIMIGMVLFILPGLYIAIRLSLTPYFVLFKNMNATDAISASVTKTKSIQWQLMGASILIFVPLIMLNNFAVEALNNAILDIQLTRSIITVLLAPLPALTWILLLRYFDIINETYGHPPPNNPEN